MNPIRKLQEQRAALLAQADSIVSEAAKESRAIAPHEEMRLDQLKHELFQTNTDLAREQFSLDRAGDAHMKSRNGMAVDQGYSLVRAIQQAGAGRLDGLELEVSQEIQRQSGKSPSGFYIPNSVLAEQRGMSVGNDAGVHGGSAIATEVMDILEALRPVSRVIAAGATTFSGLTSNIAIPRQTAASTASWVAETAELAENTPTIDQITLQPNRVGSFVELSNQLLVQTAGSIEQFIRRDLLAAIGTAIDSAAINGTGLTNQPLGLLAAAAAIGNVEGGTDGLAPTWAHLCQLIQKVADADADYGSLGYLTNSAVASKLRSTPRIASTDSRMILEGGTLLDYPVWFSNNVPSVLDKGSSTGVCSAIIFGNWADLLIGQFGAGTDVIVDRFTKATGGVTRIITQSYVDIAIRRAESFAAMKDALTA